MGKYLIIPDMERLEESICLAKEYDLGFEVNDFFEPNLQKEPERKEILIQRYTECERREPFTMHGCFHDVLIFSEDDEIRQISEKRAEDSIVTAQRIGAKAVIFHTNINPALNAQAYRERWIFCNYHFWMRMCERYPSMNIYLENMFEHTPVLLKELCEKMQDVPNFGVTLDYAHASLFGDDTEVWARELSPYIRHVHINDHDGVNDLHLAVGTGVIDWKAFLEFRAKYFPEATVLIETSDLQAQRESLKYLCEKGMIPCQF